MSLGGKVSAQKKILCVGCGRWGVDSEQRNLYDRRG